MANYLLTLPHLFLIFSITSFCVVLIPSSSAIYIVSNNATKRTEFVLFNRRSVVLPNYHRNRTSFKFSLLSGGGGGLSSSSNMNIITRVEERSPTSWRFILDNSPGPAAVHFAKKEHPKNPFITEYTFHWIGDSDRREVCFHYGHNNASWYNTYQSLAARWPMDTGRQSPRRHFNYLLDFDYDSTRDEALLLLEHLFLNSDGFALMLDSSAPLFLRRDPNFGDPLLCISVNASYPYSSDRKEAASYRGDLKFRLFAGRSAKAVYGIVANQLGLIPKPISVPASERLFRAPIWTTWNVFNDNKGDSGSSLKNAFNQENVLKYAEDIVSKYGFPNDSTLELHRRWERTYGDLAFDSTRFPDPKEMIRKLHSSGHQVTLWSYPNIHTDSTEYSKSMEYFVKANYSSLSSSAKFRASKPTPLVINYSDGAGSYVDFSNQAAAEWFVDRLKRFAESTGVDGFHLNEAVLYDYRGPLGVADPEVARAPSLLTKCYANIAYQLSGSLGEKEGGKGRKNRDFPDQDGGLMVVVDSAFKNQYLPNFVALNAKAGDWSYANGLRSLIPAVLSLSLAGYSFIVPGIVGGGYSGVLEPPPEELYIRWAQATALLPAMKFSVPPWTYPNPRVVEIVRSLVELHRNHSNLLIELAWRRVREGQPIIRPLWWASPDDPKAYLVDDQFLVGDDLLVAPVLQQGAIRRTVRLPPGNWADHNGRGPFQGPADLQVEAPLEVLPYFRRIKH